MSKPAQPKRFAQHEWRTFKQENPPLDKTVEFKTGKGVILRGKRVSDEGHYDMESPVFGSHWWRPLQPKKKTVRVIVEMHGGTIQSVEVDPAAAVELDVVFTESPKYGSGEKSETETEIDDGQHGGQIVYCQHGSSEASDEDIAAVFKAAEKRVAAFKKE